MPHEEKSWVSRWWRALVGEVLATALLMILGVGSLMPASQRVEHPLTHPALGFGFVVTALIVAFGNISGAHMNPAVTLAALVYKQIPLLPAVAYIVAQVHTYST
ncbi:major intrinsic protein domain-containing protein [Phthorimaea operculella]|nr:major intrinsic protein domain-containing protein [Phthorimaea operculella]